LVSTPAEGVPKFGVTRVGDVANTAEPEPVSSVNAPAKLADVNEPSEVALPTEVTAPVKLALVVTLPAVNPAAVPVIFVPTKVDGVPRFGVTKVGLVANTKAPEPVSFVTAALRFALVGVARKVATPVPRPDTPVEIGKSVAFVSVALEGVPKFGVTKVGEVDITTSPVPVMALLTNPLEPSVNTASEAVRLEAVTVELAVNVVNAPVDCVVAPIDMLLIVPTPPEVSAKVGVLLAVNVTRST
jgi:hypothetical protein